MKSPAYTPLYVAMFPSLCETARDRGYSLAVHGTVNRDLDLVAVPWTEAAVPAAQLVDALASTAHDWIGDGIDLRAPTPKPHGRTQWSIMLGGHAYLDVSVMPLVVPPARPEGE